MSWIYVAMGRSINFHALSLLHCVSMVKFITQCIWTAHAIYHGYIKINDVTPCYDMRFRATILSNCTWCAMMRLMWSVDLVSLSLAVADPLPWGSKCYLQVFARQWSWKKGMVLKVVNVYWSWKKPIIRQFNIANWDGLARSHFICVHIGLHVIGLSSNGLERSQLINGLERSQFYRQFTMINWDGLERSQFIYTYALAYT